uniref:Rap1a immunity protein domain-containing protein n=1 Tax=uncultured nuHF2 cluster bacterium HF0770_42C12 TaxID=723593 RepID=E7C820_9BACT|nr:hypothetical protein [uncultured nuHF2 cluster bacterium HF0770_42C12]
MAYDKAMRYLAVITLLVLALAQPVAAMSPSTNQIRAACNYENLPAEHRPLAKTMCFTYFWGYLDYHRMLTSKGRTPDQLFCLPKEGVKIGEVQSFFMQVTKDMPDTNKEPAVVTVTALLKAMFPCP